MSATGRGAVRDPQDRYMTPQWVINALLGHLDLGMVRTALEPCRGTGVIVAALESYGIPVAWCELDEGRDYLTTDCAKVDLIVTNPPYRLAREFIEKSLSEARCACYLLRLNYLGSRQRRDFWRKFPPSHVLVLSKRPSFTGGGTDATEYAWFCWDSARLVRHGPWLRVL